MTTMRQDSTYIIKTAIAAVQPGAAVERALKNRDFGNGRLIAVAVGKAAWTMADAARRICGERIETGIVITKYGHSAGPLNGFTVLEAGHPVPDSASYAATQRALDAVSGLTSEDTVLLLLSGGGSALFESPLIPPADLQYLTEQLLSCGAAIAEINTVRKRFSGVKGGRFAQRCAPAHVLTIVLSDIIGDPLDMIASGPAYPDSSTCADAQRIVEKYQLHMTPLMMKWLNVETPKLQDHVETLVTGNVRMLCQAAAEAAHSLGYATEILTDSLDCEAREAGAMLAAIARYRQKPTRPIAIITGGETVVHLTGKGLGGRNQELALSAASGIRGLPNTAIFSTGSDGTDGPTDAAGGYVDGSTADVLDQKGISLFNMLENNDAYHALDACGGLIRTGPTGTNVNDVCVLLIRPDAQY